MLWYLTEMYVAKPNLQYSTLKSELLWVAIHKHLHFLKKNVTANAWATLAIVFLKTVTSLSGPIVKCELLSDWLNCCYKLTALFALVCSQTYRAPIRKHYSNIFWRPGCTVDLTAVPCHFAYYAHSSSKLNIHKRKPPSLGTSSEEEVYTWIRLESTSLLCAAPLWSGEELISFLFFLFFLFKYMLVALIPRSMAWTPFSHPHHPSHLVMRHLGQKGELIFTGAPYTHVQDADIHIYEISLTLKHSHKLPAIKQEFMLSAFIPRFSVQTFIIFVPSCTLISHLSPFAYHSFILIYIHWSLSRLTKSLALFLL